MWGAKNLQLILFKESFLYVTIGYPNGDVCVNTWRTVLELLGLEIETLLPKRGAERVLSFPK